jgi:hypothetical protein
VIDLADIILIILKVKQLAENPIKSLNNLQ